MTDASSAPSATAESVFSRGGLMLADGTFFEGVGFGAPGNAIGEVESTKSVSDVYSPVSGVVAAVNERLADAPETINADPYGEGWLVEIRVEGGGDPTEALLDAGAYQTLVDSA